MEKIESTGRSLRSGFAWTVAGNVANGFGQWAILSVVAKLGSAELLGQFALANAIALPVTLLAHLNLRTVYATDTAESHPFGDYQKIRLWANAAAGAVLLAAAPFSGVGWALAGVTGGLLAENSNDLRFAVLQRRDRMDLIAKAMILRAALAILFTGALVWVFRSSAAAGAGFLLSRAAAQAVLWRMAPRPEDGERDPGTVLRTAIPLGVSLMLISLTANVPRYAIEVNAGARELGAFAAVWSFVTVGSTIVNAMGQAALTRLARASQGDVARLAWKTALLPVVLGACGVAAAALFGRPLLTVLYRPELAEYDDLLQVTLAAGTVGWLAASLGYVTTARRMFGAQTALLAASAVTSAVVSFAAVPRWGLYGAVIGVASAGAVQLVGQVWLLRKVA